MNLLKKSKETDKEKEEEEPNTLFLGLESVKPKVGELNIEAPIQPELEGPTEDEESEEEESENQDQVIPRYVRLNHNPDQIIGDKDAGVLTRRRLREKYCMISTIEPRTANETFADEDWINAMEEELD
ncbi:hypothetical protein SUGI_1088080 [Cryptomeria japonica]|nr:hypothetical protein SUGI_1088080 [Cryptomeria japonica]